MSKSQEENTNIAPDSHQILYFKSSKISFAIVIDRCEVTSVYWNRCVSPGIVEETWDHFVWSQELDSISGRRWQSHLWVTSVKLINLSVSLELVSFFVSLSLLSPKSSVKEKPFENVMRHHIARANWGARPGFGSVWSDFVKKDFRILPQQKMKADVKRSSLFSPTFLLMV